MNEVHLQGRISGDPETRTLPSGDELVSVRLVVPRSAAARRRSTVTVDTIDLTAWSARLRGRVAKLSDGDEVAVTGELRRRFSRTAGGVQSFMSVDLTTLTT